MLRAQNSNLPTQIDAFKFYKSNVEDVHLNNKNEDDEHPHLHLHLLTHPQQQAMHIQCSDKVCSNCANADDATDGAANSHLQGKRRSFSDMDSPSLREDIDSLERKTLVHMGKQGSQQVFPSQNKCLKHSSDELGKIFSHAYKEIALAYISILYHIQICWLLISYFSIDRAHREEGNAHIATSTSSTDPLLNIGDSDNHFQAATEIRSSMVTIKHLRNKSIFIFRLFYYNVLCRVYLSY